MNMHTSLDNRFIFSYQRRASTSYLIMKADLKEKIIRYQVEMIANNTIKGILEMDVRQNDLEVCLYYNITSKLALSDFLRTKIKWSDFIYILMEISNVFLRCSEYLLDYQNILLDKNHIYINPATLEISTVYIPVEMTTDNCNVFKEFVNDIVLYSTDIDHFNSSNYLQTIVSFVKSDNFSMKDFNRLLCDVLEGRLNNIKKPDKYNAKGEEEFNNSGICVPPMPKSHSQKKDALLFRRLFRKNSENKKGKQGKDTVEEMKNSVSKIDIATVLLENSIHTYPYLKSYDKGVSEDIPISKSEITIGRLKGKVDFVCTSNCIGKVHAQIISRNGIYYIKDLNSVNGTFINNQRIDSNKEYEINEGDKISLANMDFTLFPS